VGLWYDELDPLYLNISQKLNWHPHPKEKSFGCFLFSKIRKSNMKNLYDKNSLVFWSEKESLLREFFEKIVTIELKEMCK